LSESAASVSSSSSSSSTSTGEDEKTLERVKELNAKVGPLNTLQDLVGFGSQLLLGTNSDDRDCWLRQNPKIYRMLLAYPGLKKLNKLKGLKAVKSKLMRQLFMMFSQPDAQEAFPASRFNTILFGGPGMGKSTLVEILCEILVRIGILGRTPANEERYFLHGNRLNMIGPTVGQTAPKTKELIDECMVSGFPLILDDAQQMGHHDQSDVFSKETLDVLNTELLLRPNDLVCMIAGHKDRIQQCIFATTDGLLSRFPFIYEVGNYSIEDLRDIFLDMAAARKVLFESAGTCSIAYFRKQLLPLREVPGLADRNVSARDMLNLLTFATGPGWSRSFLVAAAGAPAVAAAGALAGASDASTSSSSSLSSSSDSIVFSGSVVTRTDMDEAFANLTRHRFGEPLHEDGSSQPGPHMVKLHHLSNYL